MDNISPHFAWYGKKPSIYELRTFGCDIYPITYSPRKLDNRTQEGSIMGYKNSRSTMKWWDPHKKRLKYCSSAKFDEYKNKFGKGWSLGSELMLGTNTSTLPTLKSDISDHLFIKGDIFEGIFNFPPRYTPLGIATQYCEHHNISYISRPENNSPYNHAFQSRNRIHFWILSIGRKKNISTPSSGSHLKLATHRKIQ